jgi:hypothetical protein
MLLRDGRQIGQLFCAFVKRMPSRISRWTFGQGAQGVRPMPWMALLRSSQMMKRTFGLMVKQGARHLAKKG